MCSKSENSIKRRCVAVVPPGHNSCPRRIRILIFALCRFLIWGCTFFIVLLGGTECAAVRTKHILHKLLSISAPTLLHPPVTDEKRKAAAGESGALCPSPAKKVRSWKPSGKRRPLLLSCLSCNTLSSVSAFDFPIVNWALPFFDGSVLYSSSCVSWTCCFSHLSSMRITFGKSILFSLNHHHVSYFISYGLWLWELFKLIQKIWTIKCSHVWLM